MIVADTSAILALIDADDRHHEVLRQVFEADPAAWVLPWAILPEIDYLLVKYLGRQVAIDFMEDVAEARWIVEWEGSGDIERALALNRKYTALDLGLVDSVVMATAERLRASAIATLDVRDFGAVEIKGAPVLLPRDL